VSPRRAALPFLLGAALAAAQDAAPLAESKQQLQSLRKDQAAQRAKADEGLRLGDSLPALSVPAAPATVPATPAAQQREREREGKSDAAARNWLVDGHRRLDRPGRGDRDATGTEETDETPLDPRDPDYFLRVYERQRAAAEGRSEREREGRDGATAGSATATMEPFLRHWLSGSPVEGVLRDTLGGPRRTGDSPGFDLSARGDTGGARPDDAATWNRDRTAGATPAAGRLADTSATTAAPNPYLAALGLDRGSGASAAPVPAPPPPTAPPAAAAWSPPELPKAEPRRAPVRPEDEAKKYFPQLRKF
jgi:hypothetical protein